MRGRDQNKSWGIEEKRKTAKGERPAIGKNLERPKGPQQTTKLIASFPYPAYSRDWTADLQIEFICAERMVERKRALRAGTAFKGDHEGRS